MYSSCQLKCKKEAFAGIDPSFSVSFYAGRYDRLLLGISPVGNPMDSVARMHTDIVVLEEPEHINWFHIGAQWTHNFQHVVSSGFLQTPYLNALNAFQHDHDTSEMPLIAQLPLNILPLLRKDTCD